jgi:signal transduction histidine kinase
MRSEQPVDILLVDDRSENLLTLKAVLEPLGHRLITARSGDEALRCLLSHDVAVILLDVQMPGIDGFETAELIRGRDRSRHTPIIFLTAINTSEWHISKGYDAGAVDYLLKPVVPDVLLSKVAVFVELHRKTAEIRQQADQLATTVGALEHQIAERQRVEAALRVARDELERRVRERTAGLAAANEALRGEIAERERLEAQLIQAQKMESIGRLAGGVAHDFNNLLTAIGGYADLAIGALPAEHAARADMHEIQKAAGRAARLTQQLLAFARKSVIDPRVVDLAALLDEVDKLLRRLIGADIAIEVYVEPELGRVRVDSGQIEQLLLNLAINARDAMPDGGTLTIELANAELTSDDIGESSDVAPGPFVMLSVADTGGGMDAHTQAHLFEPFFTTKAPGQGTGLGLATCYGIVRQHGGHIVVASEIGRGSVFAIYLPRVEADLDTRAPHVDLEEAPRGDERVLLAEDEPALRELAARMLRNQGYTVVEAANGEEALQLAQRWAGAPLDLLLTDVVMPKMSGEELAARLKALYPRCKVLFVSGYTDSATIVRGRLEEQHAVLVKPFTAATLARKVRELLND